MKIRSITYFCDPKYPLDEKILHKAGRFLTEAKSAYETAGYEVQTTRLATIPFPILLSRNDFNRYVEQATKVATTKQINNLPKLAEGLKSLFPEIGLAFASLGPALPEVPRSYQVIPEAISAAENIFYGGVMADVKRGLDLAAVKACAEIIVKCSTIEPNGFANLQFAALANVKPGTPFFPAAYHDSNQPAFAIATESADLAVRAFENAKSIEEGRIHLVNEIQKHGKRLTRIAKSLNCKFGGIDFSLAPFPREEQSLGTAFEKLGISKIGLHGSLAAAALLTESVDKAKFPHTGFNGLFMPVLEDANLAQRAAEGTLTIKDVLLYSAVCGTGLDTVPLPGDTTAEQIIPLLLDLSALALRLDKPLTARLMPIPNKKAGDDTNFDFGFFANSKVMRLESTALNAPMNGDEVLQIRKRSQV